MSESGLPTTAQVSTFTGYAIRRYTGHEPYSFSRPGVGKILALYEDLDQLVPDLVELRRRHRDRCHGVVRIKSGRRMLLGAPDRQRLDALTDAARTTARAAA